MRRKTDRFKLNYSHYFLLAVLFLCVAACFNIVKPYLDSIIMAVILSTVFYPVHHFIETRTGGRKNLSAFLSCVVLTFIGVLPVMLITLAVIGQGIQSVESIYGWFAAGNFEKLLQHPFLAAISGLMERWLPDIQKIFPDINFENINIGDTILKWLSYFGKVLISESGSILGNVTRVVIDFFMMIFVFFFIIRDHETLLETTLHLVPLSASQEQQILSKIKAVSKSAVSGALITALAQGIAGGIAFWICGLPALFWGTMMAFASLVPVVGTALIWIPASIWLFISGSTGFGVFMVVWCVLVVGSIDNFLRPIFMQGGADMSTMIIFFAILGGIQYFGILGILYGPLLFGLTTVLLYIYSLEFSDYLTGMDNM